MVMPPHQGYSESKIGIRLPTQAGFNIGLLQQPMCPAFLPGFSCTGRPAPPLSLEPACKGLSWPACCSAHCQETCSEGKRACSHLQQQCAAWCSLPTMCNAAQFSPGSSASGYCYQPGALASLWLAVLASGWVGDSSFPGGDWGMGWRQQLYCSFLFLHHHHYLLILLAMAQAAKSQENQRR